MSNTLSEPPWFPSPYARQSLLNFQHVPGSSNLQSNSTGLPAPDGLPPPSGPAPSLPNEVWHQILSPLGTIALKNFRLICRDWSVIGAVWLFRTVYLNCFEGSWSGLVAISSSCHAAAVQSIEWNALVFDPDCHDASVWTSRYQSLIHGLSHFDTVRLYHIYQYAYSFRHELKRWTPLDEAVEAIRKLTNCHHALISGDYDLTKHCDRSLSAAILSPSSLGCYPATWALRPPYLCEAEPSSFPADAQVPSGTGDIFLVFSRCCNITSMKISVWAEHLSRLTEPDFWQGRQKGANPFRKNYLTSLHCCLKIPDRPVDPHGEFPLHENIYLTMFSEFTALRTFKLEMSLCHPTNLEPETKPMRRRESIDNNTAASTTLEEDDQDSQESLNESLSEIISGGTEMCFHAPLQLDFVPFPSLTTLSLSNVALNTSSLICFLCCQMQLPKSAFSLYFEGTIVLLNFDAKVFFNALKQLNVHISYDHKTSFGFPVPPYDLPALGDHIPRLTCQVRYKDGYSLSPDYFLDYKSSDYYDDEFDDPPNLPPCPSLARQKPASTTATILDRPNQYRYANADSTTSSEPEVRITQIYRVRTEDSHTLWEWVSLSEALNPTTEQPWSNTYILHSLLASQPHQDVYYDESEGAYQEALKFDDDYLAQARQDVSQRYERELWGSDVLQRTHILEEETRHQRSREAQIVPDSAEDLLHRYETEMLGIDLLCAELRAKALDMKAALDMDPLEEESMGY